MIKTPCVVRFKKKLVYQMRVFEDITCKYLKVVFGTFMPDGSKSLVKRKSQCILFPDYLNQKFHK